MIQRISLPVSPYTVFYTKYGGKELHFIYRKMLETLCVYIEPEGAVWVCVMFNNHNNNFLTDTPQIRPEKRDIS